MLLFRFRVIIYKYFFTFAHILFYSIMRLLFIFVFFSYTHFLHATTWRVGPTRTYTYCSQVAGLVQVGDTVAIDFAVYINDVQVQWNKANLYIIGVGGRPRLEAGSIIANDTGNGKGIFVTNAPNITIDNIEFANAVVVDNNGAGIRQQGPNLRVTHCKFTGNEMGILCNNIANCKTTIEYTEFVNNGSSFNPGYQHNVYINHIDTLVFRYNVSRDAIAQGHELKSRANYNFILYNRISNEQTEDSRTIDLPNGGTSVVVGNVIEQGPNSANSNLLGYGLEGLSNTAPHRLWIHNNTFINKKSSGSFIHVPTGMDTLWVKNNIFAGAQTGGLIIGTPAVLDSSHNLVHNDLAVFGFESPVTYNYHLLASSPALNTGMMTTQKIFGYALHPTLMYREVALYESRPNTDQIDIGAFEYSTMLPLEYIAQLSAELLKSGTVLLRWETAQEINVNYFEVERSLNGSTWESIGLVSAGQRYYLFEDINPHPGHTYYRLKRFDRDGSWEYSRVASMHKTSDLMVFPNPSTGVLHLQGLTQSHYPVDIQLINTSGQVCHRVRLENHTDTWDWKESSMRPGVYVLKIEYAGGADLVKVVFLN